MPAPAAPAPEPAPPPAVKEAPPEPPKTTEPRKRAPASILGTWEGEWEVDEYGFTGHATLQIDHIDGHVVLGRSMMFDTPYGTLNEPFLIANFDNGHLNVKHRKNVAYTLTLSERGTTVRLSGPFTYVTNLGTFTGKINVVRKQ